MNFVQGIHILQLSYAPKISIKFPLIQQIFYFSRDVMVLVCHLITVLYITIDIGFKEEKKSKLLMCQIQKKE